MSLRLARSVAALPAPESKTAHGQGATPHEHKHPTPCSRCPSSYICNLRRIDRCICHIDQSGGNGLCRPARTFTRFRPEDGERCAQHVLEVGGGRRGGGGGRGFDRGGMRQAFCSIVHVGNHRLEAAHLLCGVACSVRRRSGSQDAARPVAGYSATQTVAPAGFAHLPSDPPRGRSRRIFWAGISQNAHAPQGACLCCICGGRQCLGGDRSCLENR
jgi:hypothetical protein